MSKTQQEEFLRLYQPVHARFEKFCRARAYGDMPYEDLMNETIFIALKKMTTIKSERAFLSFLIGISTKLLANARRKKKPESLENHTNYLNVADPVNHIERQFEIELLHQSLAKLPEQQREAIILFEITGFSIKEIMQIQSSSESAIKQRLARGRKELAKIVKAQMKVSLNFEK